MLELLFGKSDAERLIRILGLAFVAYCAMC